MKQYPEELTAKMHSEFTIDKDTEIKHKAGIIWLHFNHISDDEKKKFCEDYGITWEQALKWKDYWLRLSAK